MTHASLNFALAARLRKRQLYSEIHAWLFTPPGQSRTHRVGDTLQFQ